MEIYLGSVEDGLVALLGAASAFSASRASREKWKTWPRCVLDNILGGAPCGVTITLLSASKHVEIGENAGRREVPGGWENRAWCEGVLWARPTGQDKIFRVVLDTSSIASRGLLDLSPVRKHFVRKMHRGLDFFTLGSSALFCPYLAPSVVCHAVSKLVEKVPRHDHSALYEVELNQ